MRPSNRKDKFVLVACDRKRTSLDEACGSLKKDEFLG